MARSLTVKHEETPATSSLLTAFLLLAFGWLGLAAIVGAASGPSPADAAVVYGE